MKPKITSEIEMLTLNTATYHDETFSPTLVNFFFGNNGVGKSTIVKSIKSDSGINWKPGKTASDYSVLIYDEDFITANIQNYDNLPGVFTINEQNIEIQNQIAQKLSDKTSLDTHYTDLTAEKDKKQTAQNTLFNTFRDNCWNKTDALRTSFDKTQGGKKRKQQFAEYILSLKTAKEHNIETLTRLYETAFDPNACTYKIFTSVSNSSVLDSAPGNELLEKSIVSSSNTPFAEFIKILNATDWVRQGHEQFSQTSDGKCPYCQQSLPADFESQIASCFDAQYQQDIKMLVQFRDSYKSKANAFFIPLQENLKDAYPKLDLTEYQDKLTILKNTIQLNLQKIEEKITNPATVVSLDNTIPLIDEINDLITNINKIIEENNTIVNAKQRKQAECKTAVWEHMAFVLKNEVASFQTSQKSLTTEVDSLKKQLIDCNRSLQSLASEIAILNSKIVNTKATVDSINILLRDSGFQGFSICEKSGTKNIYEVVRTDGTIAKNLSEGERNFIAFLYFYHLVRGSDTADGGIKDKIVVIDDPVSSMDSNSLFIVSSLVREMIEICQNNASLEPEQVKGDYIKQIFILTHNAYFHREITYNQVSHYLYTSFFLIRKINNISTIKLCIHENPQIPTDNENYNPVQNSYAALWDEYKNIAAVIPLLNVIRRILEYYFMQLCGYDGVNIRKTILKDNKDKFIIVNADGKEDYTQYEIVSAMISYISANSCGINNGMYYVDGMDITQCRTTFKMIFTLMNQEQHYKMMMGVDNIMSA